MVGPKAHSLFLLLVPVYFQNTNTSFFFPPLRERGAIRRINHPPGRKQVGISPAGLRAFDFSVVSFLRDLAILGPSILDPLPWVPFRCHNSLCSQHYDTHTQKSLQSLLCGLSRFSLLYSHQILQREKELAGVEPASEILHTIFFSIVKCIACFKTAG